MLDLHSLTIKALNLECLWFTGASGSLCSINTPRLFLLHLCISRRSGLPDHGVGNTSSNMVNFLGRLSGTIEQLQLNIYSSQVTYPRIFQTLATICGKSHSVGFSILCHVQNNAPNLETIWMYIKTSKDPLADVEQVLTMMKANSGLSVKLKKLESFKMTSMSGTKPEMEFIKFILASSPVLRTVTVIADRAHPSYNGFTTLKELVSFSVLLPQQKSSTRMKSKTDY